MNTKKTGKKNWKTDREKKDTKTGERLSSRVKRCNTKKLQ